MFEMFCKQVGPVPVAIAARAGQLTVSMGEKLLRLHMGDDVQKAGASQRRSTNHSLITGIP